MNRTVASLRRRVAQLEQEQRDLQQSIEILTTLYCSNTNTQTEERKQEHAYVRTVRRPQHEHSPALS